MRRTIFYFTVAFSTTLALGLAVLLVIFRAANGETTTQHGPVAVPVETQRTSLPPLLPLEAEAATMSWMPPTAGGKPDLVLHIVLSTPAFSENKSEFKFVWGEYDPYPNDFPGGETSVADGVGPNGEGVGFIRSVNARYLPDGKIGVDIRASWDLAGGRRGKLCREITIAPSALRNKEIVELDLGPGSHLSFWIER